MIEDLKKYSESPTQKQIEFVEAIADKLDLYLPDEFTKEAYSEFISVWKDEYYHSKGD